jgi:acyl dehydratase
MAINRGFIGRSYHSDGVYEVARDRIRQFADAIGDPNPVYRDEEAAKALGYPDVIAPPTFLTTIQFRFPTATPILDPEFGLDYSRVVHGEQRYVHHRPTRPGDRLTLTATIEDVRDAGSNELVIVRQEVATEDGEPISTGWSTIVSRGTAVKKEQA